MQEEHLKKIKKGIMVLVLLCFSFSMSAARVSGTTWSTAVPMGSKPQLTTSFRSTSTGAYRGSAAHSAYRAYSGRTHYNQSYSQPRANSIGNHSLGSTYRPYSSSSATTRSYGGGYSAAYSNGYNTGTYRSTSRTGAYSRSGISVGADGMRSGSPVLAAASTLNRPTANATTTITKRNIYIPGISEERGDDEYYDEELGDWYAIPTGTGAAHGLPAGSYIGQTGKGDDDQWYTWNGSAWVLSPAEVSPVGAMPYIFILLIALAYITFTIHRKKTITDKRGKQ